MTREATVTETPAHSNQRVAAAHHNQKKPDNNEDTAQPKINKLFKNKMNLYIVDG